MAVVIALILGSLSQSSLLSAHTQSEPGMEVSFT